jgi:hypothetical protein
MRTSVGVNFPDDVQGAPIPSDNRRRLFHFTLLQDMLDRSLFNIKHLLLVARSRN